MQIVDLRSIRPDDAVGGKAAALRKLVQAGLQVPPGFVVIPSSRSLKDEHQIELLTHFDRLGSDLVAVRSSATSEDGNDAAWAGQLDTFLNVPREQIVERVEACMRSAGTTRAQAYAAQKNIDVGCVSVLVQSMVESETSGVAFSVHPITKSTEQMVVEAGLGLGEAVVSGEITPDTYILQKTDGKMLEQHVAAQTKLLRRAESGGNEWHVLEPEFTTPKVTPGQLEQLAAAVRTIERLFGYPVDVEWAFAQGTLYILQARPITTL